MQQLSIPLTQSTTPIHVLSCTTLVKIQLPNGIACGGSCENVTVLSVVTTVMWTVLLVSASMLRLGLGARRPFSPSIFSQALRNRLQSSLFTMGAVGVQTVHTSKRLASLRELMSQQDNSVDAFVVPSEDQRELGSVSFLPMPLTFSQMIRLQRISCTLR